MRCAVLVYTYTQNICMSNVYICILFVCGPIGILFMADPLYPFCVVKDDYIRVDLRMRPKKPRL